MQKFWTTVDGFYPAKKARNLRKIFDDRFKEPRDAHAERFQWDYWHVPDQYTVVRTPAYHYFPKKQYEEWHRFLVDWGRKNLGCFDISPPWLSYYVEGCRQEFHADIPHGPWAFVFSLTNWNKRKFTGGETMIIKPQVLDYWQSFDYQYGLEKRDIIESIPAKFNRLTIFDPRFPHAVNEVRGTHDPREARLVIHGWFTKPRPFIDGHLPEKATTRILNDVLGALSEALSNLSSFVGMLAIRVRVSKTGKVLGVELVADTLIPRDSNEDYTSKEILGYISSTFAAVKFPKAKGDSEITIPFTFG